MKNVRRLQSLMALSIIFFVDQSDLCKLSAADEAASLLLSTQDDLIESMNGLQAEVMRLDGEIDNTTCCIIPVPWKSIALAHDYYQTSKNFMNVDIPEEKKLFDDFKKKDIDAGACCVGLTCGSLCLVCLPLPIYAISTAPIVSTIGISAEVLAGVSCCYCLPTRISLFMHKEIAGKQIAIKQLYTTGKVDKNFKDSLRSCRNAFHMIDSHGDVVFDK